ncbi:hypothetical protein Zm00014a_031839 [Zea mays]|uniref:Uncharacterized protein n=1 Tax=Zea mays TaxID=4577 RepID=A0A3L6EPS6_MAIZE|nr:hypothetical protein Zm00014a_031839 [Zea mays]
MRSIANNKLVH